MPEVGRGEVLIIPDLSRFGRDLERGIGPHIDRAGRSMESTFGTAGKRSADSVEAAFKRTAGGIDIPIHADTRGLRSELEREVDPLVKRLDADVPVGADTSGFGRDLSSGVKPHLDPVDVPVHADASSFRTLPADIRPHVKKAGDEMERTLTSSASGAAKAVAVAIGAKLTIDLGRELLQLGNQTAVFQQKTRTVFEDATEDVQRWAAENAKALGLTETRLAGVAANFGDLLKPMGFTSDEAAEMSTRVVGLAGALSAWSGGTRSVVDVSETLSKAMLGEREELKGLGISITEADVKTRLLAKGQGDLAGAALQQAEAIATQELIFEKSTDAQTAWANGSFDAIKKQNELRSKVGELTESLAEGLLPVFAAATDALNAIDPALVSVVAGVAGLGAAVYGIVKVSSALTAMQAAASASSLGAGALAASATRAAGGLLKIGAAGAAIYGIKQGLDALGLSAQGLEAKLEDVATATNDELVKAFREFQKIGEGDDLFREILGQSVTEAQRFVDALEDAGVETANFQKEIDKSITGHRAAAGAKEKDAKVTGDLGDETSKLGGHVARSRAEMDKFNDTLNDAYGASQNLIGSTIGVADAINSLRDSAAESAGKERELAEAIRTHGRASAEAQVAGEALEDARRRQLGDVDALAQATVNLASQQATAAGKTLSDADKYRIYRDELIKVKDTLAPDAPLRKHLQGLIDQLPPPVIKSQVVIDTAKATAEIAKFLPLVQSLQSKFGGALSGKFLPTKHTGGPIEGAKGEEVPILAKSGEFVVQDAAVDVVGLDFLERLNEAKPGQKVEGPLPAVLGATPQPQVIEQFRTEVSELEQFHTGGVVGPASPLSLARPPTVATLPPGAADRIPSSVQQVTTNNGGTRIDVGGIAVSGVRDGEEAATLVAMRLRSELFLVGG